MKNKPDSSKGAFQLNSEEYHCPNAKITYRIKESISFFAVIGLFGLFYAIVKSCDLENLKLLLDIRIGAYCWNVGFKFFNELAALIILFVLFRKVGSKFL